MLDKLDRWIELLSQSGKNTKQQVLEEMKIERENTKSAKEMFEELGYEQTNNDLCLISYKLNEKKIEYGKRDYIEFSFTEKIYYCCVDYAECDGAAKTINVELHKAIHKQLEELGWK